MPGRGERSGSSASSTQSFSEDQAFSAENDDINIESVATSPRRGRNGLAAVQASGPLRIPSNRSQNTSDAPTTSRAYGGGLATVRASERFLQQSKNHNSSSRDTTRVRSFSESRGGLGADNAGKLMEEGIRYTCRSKHLSLHLSGGWHSFVLRGTLCPQEFTAGLDRGTVPTSEIRQISASC